jgi:hypothetical protein
VNRIKALRGDAMVCVCLSHLHRDDIWNPQPAQPIKIAEQYIHDKPLQRIPDSKMQPVQVSSGMHAASIAALDGLTLDSRGAKRRGPASRSLSRRAALSWPQRPAHQPPNADAPLRRSAGNTPVDGIQGSGEKQDRRSR